RQPVLLDLWAPGGDPPSPTFTTVGSWKQKWRDVEFRGERYWWSKHHEFLKFLDLPHRTGEVFELALSPRGLEEEDRRRLTDAGWRVRDGLEISRDPDRYRTYIQCSRGEFTVAKDQNVRLRTGWFSDRSATYLAAGRPVITQDTAFGENLPTGSGLFPFTTAQGVETALEAIRTDYPAHSRAAREIAREYFAHDVVLPRLLEEALN
ncbi:MAG: glycosyltransferase, partial [bacterium]